MNIDELVAAMQAIVDVAENENRALNDDEITRYEALEADLNKARKSVEIRNRQNAYTTNVIVSPITGNAKGDEVLERAFDHYLRTGVPNQDLVELRTGQSTTDAAGGYTIPPGFRQKLVDRKLAFGGLASVAENITTDSGNSIEWPTVDDTSNTGAITAEASAITSGNDLVFGTATLGAYKYTATGGGSNLPLKVSVELLQDSAFDVSGFVAKKLGERIARKQAAHWTEGTGSSEPLGLMHTTKDVEATTPTYAKLLDVVHTVDPEYRGGSKWLMNDSTLKSIRALVDDNSRPIWQSSQNAGIVDMPGGTLLGYAVIIDQQCHVTASGYNYIAFGDFNEAYVIRHVKDITVVVNPYSSASTGQVEFHAWARADGTIQNRYAYATLAND